MKVCFVGIGSIAKRHIKNLSKLCSEQQEPLIVDALRREKKREEGFPGIIQNIFVSSQELPKDYDVIFLTNPTEYHAKMLQELHNHGRHFFIEKPLTSLATLHDLDHFIPREGSVYYVACPLRYNKTIQYVKNHIHLESVFGVRCISSSFLPDWRPGTDYRMTYSAHKELGGGVDIDLIHEWDYLTYLFGFPTEIKCFRGQISRLEIDSNDYSIYIARYGKERIVELHLDYYGRKTRRELELYTPDETIVADLVNNTISYLKEGSIIHLDEDRDQYQQREMQTFLDAIKGENCAINDLISAKKVLKLTQGIIEGGI